MIRAWLLKLTVRALSLAAFLHSSGCALLSKAEPMSPRYFSPALELRPSSSPSAAAGLDLRLGQIESATHLEERIAYRVSDTELGYYEDRRWTEPPEQFVRRALESELFETRGVNRVVSGACPTLDIELSSFEELRERPPRVRLALSFSLRDDRRALLERTLVVEKPIAAGTSAKADTKSDDDEPDTAGALAVAMSSALGQAVAEVADQVIAALRENVSASATSDQPVPRAASPGSE